jgi:hypothetical protein
MNLHQQATKAAWFLKQARQRQAMELPFAVDQTAFALRTDIENH